MTTTTATAQSSATPRIAVRLDTRPSLRDLPGGPPPEPPALLGRGGGWGRAGDWG